MGKINVGRLIMGGIVAGIAIDLLDYLVDGIWLAPRWADGMALLGRPGFSPALSPGRVAPSIPRKRMRSRRL